MYIYICIYIYIYMEGSGGDGSVILIESRRSPHDHALSRHFGLGRCPPLLKETTGGEFRVLGFRGLGV